MAYPCLIMVVALASIPVTSIGASDNPCAVTTTIHGIEAESSKLQPIYDFGTWIISRLATGSQVPYSHIRRIIDQFAFPSSGQTHSVTLDQTGQWAKTLLTTQVGYSIAAICALVFAIAMPLAGIIFACCRWAGHCGGERYQGSPTDNGCRTLTALCVLSALALTLGIVGFAFSNQEGWTRLPGTRDALDQQLGNVVMFKKATVKQLQCQVHLALSNASDFALGGVHRLPSQITDKLIAMTGMELLLHAQQELETIAFELMPGTVKLMNESMTFAADYSLRLRNFSTHISAKSIPPDLIANATVELKNYIDHHLFSTIEIVHKKFRDVITQPNKNITKHLQKPLSDLEKVVKTIHDQRSTIKKKVETINDTIQRRLREIRARMEPATNYINHTIRPELYRTLSDDQLKSYKWAPLVLLVIVLPIIVIASLVICGVFCGFIFNEYERIPYRRSDGSNHGGNCMIAVAALCFIFGSILMLVALALFSISYASQQLICKPVFVAESPKMFQLWDDVLVKLGAWNNHKDRYYLKLHSLVTSCKNDKGAYSALNLSQVVDLDEVASREIDANLNFSKFIDTSQIKTYRVPDEISNLIPSDISPLVKRFNDSMTVYTKKLALVPRYTLRLLDQMRNDSKLTPGELIRAQNLSSMFHDWSSTRRMHLLKDIEATRLKIDGILQVGIRINKLASSPAQQRLLVKNLTSFTEGKIENLSGTLRSHVNRAIVTIKEDVGPCRPLYDIFQNCGTLICKNMLNIVQGLWISLLWCLLWFIPTIFWAVCLAKYLHRMDRVYYKRERTDDYIQDPTDASGSF